MHDFAQRQRQARHQRLASNRLLLPFRLSAQAPAGGAPHGLDHARGVAVRIGVGQGPALLAAARGIAALETRRVRVAEVDGQLGLPVAAGPAAGGHRRRQLDAGDRRLHRHLRGPALGLGLEVKHQRLEVDQQPVGPGVVGAQRVVVKRGRIVRRQPEHAAVQQDVALDGRHALGADGVDQIGQALAHQLGVAAALNQQVAVQHAVLDGALGVHARLPEIARAQQVQPGVGGHQLHHRGRVHRRIGPPRQARRGRRRRGGRGVGLAAGVDRLGRAADGARRREQRRHHHGYAGFGNARARQRLRHLGRQGLRARGAPAQHAAQRHRNPCMPQPSHGCAV